MAFKLKDGVDTAGAGRINFAGQEWFLPPMTLRRNIKIWSLVSKLRGKDANVFDGEQLEAFAQVLHVALSDNYPDLTLDAVLDTTCSATELCEAAAEVLKHYTDKPAELAA